MKRSFALLAVLFTAIRTAPAAEFLVKPGAGNKVVFVSKATMERFEGKTDQLDGRIVVDPVALGNTITVHLEVNMGSLDTGIGLRNRHMNENHLETAKYPKAIFDGATIVGPAGAVLEPGKPTTFEAEGTFTLHGVSRPLRVRVEATYRPSDKGGKIEFSTGFTVALDDYKISRPEFLFLKLAETQDIRVTGVAVAAVAAP